VRRFNGGVSDFVIEGYLFDKMGNGEKISYQVGYKFLGMEQQ
jgi:hypothetical protein